MFCKTCASHHCRTSHCSWLCDTIGWHTGAILKQLRSFADLIPLFSSFVQDVQIHHSAVGMSERLLSKRRFTHVWNNCLKRSHNVEKCLATSVNVRMWWTILRHQRQNMLCSKIASQVENWAKFCVEIQNECLICVWNISECLGTSHNFLRCRKSSSNVTKHLAMSHSV